MKRVQFFFFGVYISFCHLVHEKEREDYLQLNKLYLFQIYLFIYLFMNFLSDIFDPGLEN
jgi:hypothetical protein